MMRSDVFMTMKDPALAAVKGILTGVGGTLVVALFLTGIIRMEQLSAVLPWVVGFNGALSGYRLVELLRAGPFHKKTLSFLPGMITGALTWCSLNIFFLYGARDFIFSVEELLLYVVISGCTGYLGAGLASRYLDL